MNKENMTGNIKFIVLTGLPRSGKSTKASALRDEVKGVIVSRDSVRLALHGTPFIRALEEEVRNITRLLVRSLILSGHHSIIIDECNLCDERLSVFISDCVKGFDFEYEIEYIHCDTTVDVCKERAITTGQPWLLTVIDEMQKEYKED